MNVKRGRESNLTTIKQGFTFFTLHFFFYFLTVFVDDFRCNIKQKNNYIAKQNQLGFIIYLHFCKNKYFLYSTGYYLEIGKPGVKIFFKINGFHLRKAFLCMKLTLTEITFLNLLFLIFVFIFHIDFSKLVKLLCGKCYWQKYYFN